MLGGIGMQELLIILLIILLFFGAKRIPEIAKGIGKGMREFKKAARDVQDEINLDEKSDEITKDEKKT